MASNDAVRAANIIRKYFDQEFDDWLGYALDEVDPTIDGKKVEDWTDADYERFEGEVYTLFIKEIGGT